MLNFTNSKNYFEINENKLLLGTTYLWNETIVDGTSKMATSKNILTKF
jgi:hypothetical protein